MTQAPTVASAFAVVPTHLGRIGVDAARHALQAENVHGEESQVEADEENPEA